MESENRKKFVELAEKRVNKAIKAIQLIGNLSNQTNYKYDATDATKIYNALKREIEDVKDRFAKNSKDSDTVFRL